MYIPAQSSADTLCKLKEMIGAGSRLGMSYVDDATYGSDDDIKARICDEPKYVRKILAQLPVEEPWITVSRGLAKAQQRKAELTASIFIFIFIFIFVFIFVCRDGRPRHTRRSCQTVGSRFSRIFRSRISRRSFSSH